MSTFRVWYDVKRTFSNPLTSFNKFRLAVSKGPPIFAVSFHNNLIIK